MSRAQSSRFLNGADLSPSFHLLVSLTTLCGKFPESSFARWGPYHLLYFFFLLIPMGKEEQGRGTEQGRCHLLQTTPASNVPCSHAEGKMHTVDTTCEIIYIISSSLSGERGEILGIAYDRSWNRGQVVHQNVGVLRLLCTRYLGIFLLFSPFLWFFFLARISCLTQRDAGSVAGSEMFQSDIHLVRIACKPPNDLSSSFF